METGEWGLLGLPVASASPAPGFPDLLTGGLQYAFISGILPLDKLTDQDKEALPLPLDQQFVEGRLGTGVVDLHPSLCGLLVSRFLFLPDFQAIPEVAVGTLHGIGVSLQLLHIAGGVVDHLGKDYRPGGRKGTTGPPEVESRRVSMPYGFLTSTGCIDLLQRECNLDEFLGIGHRENQVIGFFGR